MTKHNPKGWVFINFNSLFFLSSFLDSFCPSFLSEPMTSHHNAGALALCPCYENDFLASSMSSFADKIFLHTVCASWQPSQNQSFNKRDDRSFFNSSNSTPLFSAVLTSHVHLLVDNALRVKTPVEEENWRDEDQVHTGHPETNMLVLEISCYSG